MKHFIYRMLITSLAVLFVAEILPGIEVTGLLGLILTALILGVLNAFLRPLMVILTLPLTIFTFGLFIFFINGAILYLTSAIVSDFEITSIWIAVIASILISLVSSAISWLAKG
jgi:putative membrane protein